MRSPRDTEVREEDLERWIRRFRGPLVGLVASWGADWSTAEELAQDAFAEAWLARERFIGHPVDLPAVGAWLRGIAFHLHAARQRREQQRRAFALEEREHATPVVAQDERREQLTAAFALLGITQKAVEERLYRARKALREEVERMARASAEGVRT